MHYNILKEKILEMKNNMIILSINRKKGFIEINRLFHRIRMKFHETNSISYFLTSSYLLKATKLNIETITLYQKIIITVSKTRVKLNLEIDIR